jgi:putative component of membrane protein insertase Oxa1/YidC/SpoIIIJ protein YidD
VETETDAVKSNRNSALKWLGDWVACLRLRRCEPVASLGFHVFTILG